MNELGYRISLAAFQEDSDELDILLRDLVGAADDARRAGGRELRWAALKAMYRMEPDSSGQRLFPEWPARCTPLLASRVDRVAESVHQGLAAKAPYCQARPLSGGTPEADQLEKGVQALAQRAGIDAALRMALRDAALYSPGFLWAALGPRGLRIESVSPDRMVVLPSWARTTQEACLMGHRFQIARWEVEEARRKGGWRSLDLSPGGGSAAGVLDQAMAGDPAQRDWQSLKLAHILIRLRAGDEDGWWSVIYSDDLGRWLKVERYPLKTPWYVPVRLTSEPHSFWPETSPANRLQHLQHLHSSLCTILEQGGMFASVGVLTGSPPLRDKLQTFRPGQFLAASPGTEVKAIFPPFRFEGVLAAIEKLERDADQAVGISRFGTAQELKDATATEVRVLKAAQEQAANAYASHAADALEELFSLIQETAATHASQVARSAPWLDAAFWEAARLPVEWTSSGRALDIAPELELQRLMQAYQIASAPGSSLDLAQTEKEIVRALELPPSLARSSDPGRLPDQQA